MSFTANARSDGLFILPRRPPKSPGPFFAKVITPQLQPVPFPFSVDLFLIVCFASVLPSTHCLIALTDQMPEHLPKTHTLPILYLFTVQAFLTTIFCKLHLIHRESLHHD